jgi:nucleotide-binding universal stress UspA family protein
MSNGTTLVGVNGSASSTRALDWAAARVAERGGRLRILCVVDLVFGAEVYGSRFDPVENASAVLDEATRRVELNHPGLDVTADWVDGRPISELVKASADAELVVIGTDKSPDNVGPRVGTIPLTVAARSHSAVAVIPDAGPRMRRGVIVGIDKSPESRAALAVAVREASWLGTTVRAVHAWRVPPPFESDVTPDLQPEPGYEAELQSVLDDAIESLTVPVPDRVQITTELARENPALALVDRALRAELLVVGCRGRGRVASYVLGSVSHDVLLNITCPVIVVSGPMSPVITSKDVAEEEW